MIMMSQTKEAKFELLYLETAWRKLSIFSMTIDEGWELCSVFPSFLPYVQESYKNSPYYPN